MSEKRSTRNRREAHAHRLKRLRSQGPRPISTAGTGLPPTTAPQANATLDCGWGRLLFGQTFATPDDLADALRSEAPDRRDVAFYVREPHVTLAIAPHELFLDPSHTYRLDLSTYRASRRRFTGFFVRRLSSEADAVEVNRIYAARGMVPVSPQFFWSKRDSRAITVFVAEDERSGAIIGTAMGVDHVKAFDDPELGASLWCLAVDPQAEHPGIGEALVRRIAEHFQGRGAVSLDLSVLHDNVSAIALYEKLGFRRIPAFAIKRKNPINERLFTGGSALFDALNPYARIIVDEAWRRGIGIDVEDAEGGFFRLTHGGRSVLCRESLSEFTSAVAMSICDDKAVTRRVVAKAGVAIPAQIEADDPDAIAAFLAEHGALVVKPARGEQGRGISVGLETMEDVEAAIANARTVSDRVIIEQMVSGDDLRLVIINFELVAAAVRKPARVVGDGTSTIRALIARQSRRRAAATGGESTIPLDAETERCVAKSGLALDDVPERGREVQVRSTANLHTGGTIHDVTDSVHPDLVAAGIAAAQAIDIPVVGIDLMVKDPAGPDYAFIEANERPGLANHEPRPTAERFIDLLFPLSIPHRP